MDISGQVAIVTGSSSGIGAATAQKLASRGARVIVNYSKSKGPAEEVAQACVNAGGEAIVVAADVSEDADCQRMVGEAVGKWGRVDMLVNNAGRTKFADHDKLDKLQKEDFLDIYALNVVGPYQMTRACAPHMKRIGNGRIVNVSSIAGIKGIGSSIAYAASKGALNTMTVSLARALAPEIRVNAIMPGFVGTGWFRDRFGEEAFQSIVAANEKVSPLGRAGTPEDMAESIVFFCAEGGQHITGQHLVVDAGYTITIADPRPFMNLKR
jgi:3-oxoacyl-[acyl-carrier protein] reductase